MHVENRSELLAGNFLGRRRPTLCSRELQGARFGTIRSMRIRLIPDERMEGVLRGLRESSAQELLFVSTTPVDEALGALFMRCGGCGPTGLLPNQVTPRST